MLPDLLRRIKDEIGYLADEADNLTAALVATNRQLTEKLGEFDRLRGVSTFGFDYWPQHRSSDTLYDDYWVTLQPTVAADFDHMLSMGAAVVRIVLWPQGSFDPGYQNLQGRPFRKVYYEQTRNLVELVRLAHERDLKAIVVFGNNYFDCGLPDEIRIRNDDGQSRPLPHRWWMDAYPNSFVDFLNDTREWIDGFVNAVEGSAYKSAVLYYDFENEYSAANPYVGWYLIYLYDWSAIPAGKRGSSVMSIPSDVDDLGYQLDVGMHRHLDYVDFHSYPEDPTWGPVNPDIEYCYQYMKGKFPDSCIVFGEFGRHSNPSQGGVQQEDEQRQQSVVVDLVARARCQSIPYYMNWLLWDATHPTDIVSTSFGSNPHAPKDVLGAMVSLLGLLRNADMEEQTDSTPPTPTHWYADGTAPFEFCAMGPAPEDAATNQWYARIMVPQATGSVWLASDMTPVTGGKRLFVNAYIRASMAQVGMDVHEYDEDKHEIAVTSGPAFKPEGWCFNSYLHRVGSWSVPLNPATRYIIVTVGGVAQQNPSYLDIDTVSAWTHP